jgi:hypothetical protein
MHLAMGLPPQFSGLGTFTPLAAFLSSHPFDTP